MVRPAAVAQLVGHLTMIMRLRVRIQMKIGMMLKKKLNVGTCKKFVRRLKEVCKKFVRRLKEVCKKFVRSL